ncbi:MGMT family protein [Solimonas sp. SE-A11]|uniref:MGMT family protein n=1 Tax=Solimonas sp. SE-A11 TaxID=3054954 RepID=UPI00259C70BC|nr:MGMT family protein [Solimonas sp. SE-A11]MDM4771521.1 MGMT family protein [Solimonas sp. SE-A11]
MGKLQEDFEKIWGVIRRVPLGRVATYGQVAAEAGFVKRPRLTAQALAHVPPGMEIPWHRIINAQGKSSMPEGSRGHREQLKRLKNEGVKIVKGKIDLEVYRWRPRSLAPLLD